MLGWRAKVVDSSLEERSTVCGSLPMVGAHGARGAAVNADQA